MNKSQYFIQLTGKILLILTTLLISSPSSASMRLIISQRPESPYTKTPRGAPTPAATRGGGRECSQNAKPLTALFANNGSDFTVSEYPTFWFYIPYFSQQIAYMEFLVEDAKENRTVYQTTVKLTDKPGIIKLSIPDNPQYALKVNKIYRWRFYLKVNCSEVDKDWIISRGVNGWISRVPITSQLENQLEKLPSQKYLAYQEAGIWYDAIANLGEQHFTNRENKQLSSAWTQLLESLNRTGVSEEPLVNSELLPPKD